MHCDDWRLEISSHLDGEASASTPAQLEAHLVSCGGCRGFAMAVARLDDRVATANDAEPPSRRAELLTAMAAERGAGQRRRELVRIALLVVALTQLALALPALVLGDGAGGTHVTRHIGAWDVALAVGFIVAVAQPVRAVGLLPMAAALAGCMVAAAALDVASGAAAPFGEAIHAIELAGLALLWALSRSTPRPEGLRRPVWAVAP